MERKQTDGVCDEEHESHGDDTRWNGRDQEDNRPEPDDACEGDGQAHNCRRRIPIPVPNATMAANPLRKAWPASST